MWIHLAECLPNVIAARVIFLPFSKFLKASQGTPFSKSISVAKGCSANGWSSQMRTTDSCDRNLSTLHSQKISDVGYCRRLRTHVLAFRTHASIFSAGWISQDYQRS